ncbi:MAG TPA: serine protease, partial [Xylella fastidiosa subsp. pauca]
MRIIAWLTIYRPLLFPLISGGFMSQFQKNRFYFGNTVVFTLLVLLSLGAQAKP